MLRFGLGFAVLAVSCGGTPPVPFPAGMANFHVLDDLEERQSDHHTELGKAVPEWLRGTGARLECSQHYCGSHLCSTHCWGQGSDQFREGVDAALKRLSVTFGKPQRSWRRFGKPHRWRPDWCAADWIWDWRPVGVSSDQIFGRIVLESDTCPNPKGGGVSLAVTFESTDGYPQDLPGICSCCQHPYPVAGPVQNVTKQ